MPFIEAWNEAGIVGKAAMTLAVATLAMAIACVVRPNERRLALMRPLSLATIFAALCAFCGGLASVLSGIAATGDMTAVGWSRVALGTSEVFMGMVNSFVCLTFAWLLIAVAMRKGALEVG